MKDLIKVDPKEYGLEETKAADISKMFKPMLDKMEALEEEFNAVNKLEITKETCKKAKELRLKYVKVRTSTSKIHKELKAFYLQGGRFVDGWKNAQLMASQGVETKLSNIEKHFENIEKERIEKIQEERIAELKKYDCAVIPENLGVFNDEVWKNFLIGTKASFKAKKEAEALEAERLEQERKEAEAEAERKRLEEIKKEKERKALEKENKKLRKEAEEKERIAKEAENKRLEAQRKEKEEQEAILAEERKKQEALEAEIRERKEKEEEAERLKLEEARKAEAAPDKEKVLNLAKNIASLELPTLKTKHGKSIIENVKVLLQKVEYYIIENSENF